MAYFGEDTGAPAQDLFKNVASLGFQYAKTQGWMPSTDQPPQIPKTVEVGGRQIPWWAIAGGLALLFVMK